MNTDFFEIDYSVIYALLWFFLSLIAAPLLPGMIRRIRAQAVGGGLPSVFQDYHLIAMLFKRGVVRSESATWISCKVPVFYLCILIFVLLLLPVSCGIPALVCFPGDFIFVIMLLALTRFVLGIAAMDSGNTMAVMGTSRWISLAFLSEPAFFLAAMTAIILTRAMSFSGIPTGFEALASYATVPFILIGLSLFAVLLFENALTPFENAQTPNELSGIITNVIAPYSGYELGLIIYCQSLKLWIYAWLIGSLAVPHVQNPLSDLFIRLTVPFLIAFAVGLLSAFRPLTRFSHLSRVLFASLIIAVLALIFAVVTIIPLEG